MITSCAGLLLEREAFNALNCTCGVFGRKLLLLHNLENINCYVCAEEIYSTYVADSIELRVNDLSIILNWILKEWRYDCTV